MKTVWGQTIRLVEPEIEDNQNIRCRLIRRIVSCEHKTKKRTASGVISHWEKSLHSPKTDIYSIDKLIYF